MSCFGDVGPDGARTSLMAIKSVEANNVQKTNLSCVDFLLTAQFEYAKMQLCLILV